MWNRPGAVEPVLIGFSGTKAMPHIKRVTSSEPAPMQSLRITLVYVSLNYL
ncbi:MAG: hypothetical protein HFJ95_06020 [Muribaculaceae bacterium]|nr:hypothetical protein [Muribaculaceae bacterium]